MSYRLLAVLLLTAARLTAQPAEKPLPAKAAPERLDAPPLVTAKAWAVADGKTGKLLYGGREAEPLAIASTTKIMTARVVLRLAAEDAKVLDETLTVSAKAAGTTGSSAKIKAGEKYRVGDLLYGLLLPSGNDAAVAFAEHFGPRLAGKEEGKEPEAVATFVAAMNREAKALKLGETKYLDPHGLGRNESSARDLAVLAARTLEDKHFRAIVTTRRHRGEAIGPDGEKRAAVWENTNRLLGIEGYDGVKTGTTNAAGNCLVASGHHDGDHLIVVILGSTSADGRYVDARNLFRWAWRERGAK
jgi:D-alanyl-D-alanine carboxypeptidase (penicillin-binding protein 5/6)